MTAAADRNTMAAAAAEGKLVRLEVQVEAMQAVLVRLLQDVVRAESRLALSSAAPLLEVNQQLMVAALTSQADAEAAAQALKDAVQFQALDALTQLPNRNTLLDRFMQAIAHAKRHGSRLALLFLDLDKFKQLNDTHGHAFGDKVLKLVAARMLSVVREVDTVSRHGGDEFLILLADVKQPGDAQAVAEKLIAAIAAPASLDGVPATLTASIGIAIHPDDGDDFAALVARADAAMYQSKRRCAGGIAFHGTGPAPASRNGLARRQAAPTGAAEGADAHQRYANLRKANEQLVLAALTAQELQAAAELAQQRQAAFIAAVVDELRSPAAPIRIASAMLGRDPADEPLLPRVQAMVEQQMAHMARLVSGLVDVSSVDTHGWVLQRRWVDVAYVIYAAVAANRPSMKQRGQIFESHRPPGAMGVQGDAARLEQVISNLLDNASKHTHDGGQIGLSVVMTDDTLTLSVSDNGIGITPQMLPHVFEPFVQDTHALGFNGVGLGIGLTVARALVRAHGGNLVAHSAGASRGSQFVLTLPLAAKGPP